jgi:hypothetical protein
VQKKIQQGEIIDPRNNAKSTSPRAGVKNLGELFGDALKSIKVGAVGAVDVATKTKVRRRSKGSPR